MGELCALGAAIAWALAVILLKRSGETTAPFALNVFRVTVSSAALVATLAVAREPFFPSVPREDYAILCVSGIIGIAVSDTLFHMALNRVGAGIMAILGCLYSPFVVVFAYFLVGERLGIWQFVGMALVIAAVLTTAKHRPPRGSSRSVLLLGISLGIAAMATTALGIVIAKPVLNRSSVLWATTVRQIACLVVMFLVVLISPGRRGILATLRPGHGFRFRLGATFCGSYLSLLLWIAGMKYALMGTAAILNQTSTIYQLLFASLFLHEAFTRRKAIAAVLALGGILLVTMG
jgi:drug/metabolite transporter (DMT)-like permease